VVQAELARRAGKGTSNTHPFCQQDHRQRVWWLVREESVALHQLETRHRQLETEHRHITDKIDDLQHQNKDTKMDISPEIGDGGETV
jgi:hypothetical protein